jgi:hypothetical protein
MNVKFKAIPGYLSKGFNTWLFIINSFKDYSTDFVIFLLTIFTSSFLKKSLNLYTTS